MKEYIEPEVEIIEYLLGDIIAASTATTGQDGESSNGNGSGGGIKESEPVGIYEARKVSVQLVVLDIVRE